MAELDIQPVAKPALDIQPSKPALDIQPAAPAPTMTFAASQEIPLMGGNMAPLTMRELFNVLNEPFVELPKPEVTEEDKPITAFTKGVIRSGVGAVEGLETRTSVGLLGLSLLPVVGKPIARVAAAGFGVKSTLEGFKEAAQAFEEGSPEKAGEAVGNLAFGGLMVRQSVAPKPIAFDKLDEARRGITELAETHPVKQEVAGTYDAISNLANLAGRQTQNKLELAIPDKLDREAMPAVVQAPTMEKMLADADKVLRSDAPQELKDIYQHALDNYERLSEHTSLVDEVHQTQLNDELASGIDTDVIENYVAQRWDMDTMLGADKPVVLDATGGKGGASKFFRKQRVFPDYATGIAAGYIPKNLDIAALAAHRVRAGQMLVNQRVWAESLRSVTSPLDGNTLVTELERQPKGTLVPPRGYVSMPLFGQQVAVNESFAPLINALTGASLVPRIVVKGPAAIKHGLLFFDTFHASRIAQMAAAAGVNPLKMGKRGLSVLEYAPEDLAEAVKQGEITQKMADYANANRAILNEGVSAGLNVARISDALYKDVVATVPVVGGYTKWLFDKFQRGLMAETYIKWRKRNAGLYPEESSSELARRTASEVNTFFRNLGSQGVFKSRTWQDVARVVLLAPQWVEGGVRTEARALGQVAKTPLDIAQGNMRVGNLAKTVGSGLLAYVAVTQLINMASTGGHPTWDNPEGHKMDAYVPDWLSDSEGYWFSPLSVFGEMTHDFVRYGHQENSELGVASRILSNKLNPVMRAEEDLRTGRDYFDRPLPTDMDRFMQAGYDLLPVPIPLQATYAMRPGQAQQTLMSSAGFKTEKVMSEKSQKGMRAALVDEQLQYLISQARTKPIGSRMSYILDERAKRISEEDRPIFDNKLREALRKGQIHRR